MKRLRELPRIVLILLIAVVAIILAYVVVTVLRFEERIDVGVAEHLTNEVFYDESNIDKTINKPGQLLRIEKLFSAPDVTQGWRIVYRSTDIHGNPILASGLIVAPMEFGDKELPVIAWGHPTTGIAARCAPSSGIDPFDSIEGLRQLVHAGNIVVAPDYSGMGIAGPPSFLIGESEGRTMLDIVRAVQQMSMVPASKDVVFWGHSQGGHASLFASQIAASYAPELNIKGVAAAAPATDLDELIKSDIGDISGVTIGSYAFNEYSKTYNVDLGTIVSPQAEAVMPDVAKLCLLGQNAELHTITQPLIGNFLTADPATAQPWADLLQKNTPTGPPTNVPLFIAQGQKDTLIKPSITDSFIQTQRSRGVQVTYLPIEDSGHGMIALDAIPDLLKWLNDLK